MPATDEITVRFKTEGGHEVEETFRRAGEASDQFHQKITKAGSALGDLRIKSESRVANNIGAIAASMSQGGNAATVFATAVTKVSESFRGSLLFAGAATVGLALYEGITRAGEAAIALDTKILGLRRDTSVSGDFLGADKVNQNLTTALSTIDQLRQRFTAEHTGIGGEFNQALRGALELRTRPQLEAKDAEQIADARKAALDALSQQADKQFQLNDAMRVELTGDEKIAALKRQEIASNERLGQIAKAVGTLGLQGVSEAEAAEREQSNLERAAIEKRFDLADKQLTAQAKIVDAEKELLPVNEQNLKILGLRVSAARDLANSLLLGSRERAQANIALGGAEANLQRAQFSAYQSGYNPGQFAFQKILGGQQQNDFDYFRNKFKQDEQNRALYPDLDKRSDLLRQYEQSIFGNGGADKGDGLVGSIQQLVQTLIALPAQIGVG